MVNEKNVNNQQTRKIRFSVYVAVIAFTALIFVFGILFGNSIASSKSDELSLNQQKLFLLYNGLDLKEKLLSEQDICKFNIRDLLNERAKMGANIETLEARFGKTDQNILLQKEIYELVELKTIFLLKEYNAQCNKDYIGILFFYTNKENDPRGRWQASEDQGFILNALAEKNPDKVNIFSFDINIKNPATDSLMEIYNVSKTPALIIGNQTYGYKLLNELGELIK